MAARSTRDRPAKPPLSLDAVVQAGLAVLKRESMGAVTMRRVAEELDTGPASLYVYVANRDELLRHMLEAVVSHVAIPTADPARWREQLKTMLRESVTAMNAYPGIARVALASVPGTTPAEGDSVAESSLHTLEYAEATLALLRAGGVGPQAAAWAADLLALYITATSVEAAVYTERGDDEASVGPAIHRMRAMFEALPSDRFPHVVALASAMTVGRGDERFEFGLDVLMNGLLATPEPTAATGWPPA